MKWTILLNLIFFCMYCATEEVKENKPAVIETPKSEVVQPAKTDSKPRYLDIDFAKERLLKDQTDAEKVGKAKALIHEANTLSKLKKNDDAILKFEEAFGYGTDGEAYYRYGNTLSNIQKLEESIQAYDIALELGYEKPYYALYNKACSFSMLKNAEESFKYILIAVDKGYKAIPYMQEDPDLEYIRSLPEWKSKYKEIKKRFKERDELEKTKG
ncbi:MAG: hypothetical protein IPL26_09020 [Leptospiraceae bacterium]|nr:hypothetical protein [Leptospiraceae bacterium]